MLESIYRGQKLKKYQVRISPDCGRKEALILMELGIFTNAVDFSACCQAL
jgi:hypothetical protein